MRNAVLSGVIAVVLFIANFGAQLYFKWVPDVESQKRQLKQLALLAFDILVLAAQFLTLYLMANSKETITPGFVVRVSLFASLTTIAVMFTLFRRLLGKEFKERLLAFGEGLVESSNQHGKDILWLSRITEMHIEETDRQRQAITQMLKAQKLPEEAAESIRRILSGPSKQSAVSAPSPNSESDKKHGHADSGAGRQI